MYRASHREEILARKAARRDANPTKDREHRAAYYAAHREERCEHQAAYYEANRARRAAYLRANRARVNARRNERKANEPQFKLSVSLRGRLRLAVKNGSRVGSAVRDLGCSIPELKAYLESLFEPGMSWGNWTSDGWHIDHIIPLAAFDLTDPWQLKQACHYTNLRPMWATENMRKGAKRIAMPRGPLVDPQPGDRVRVGEAIVAIENVVGAGITYIEGDSPRKRFCLLSEWRERCRRNKAERVEEG
jgi:hypothetical protein